MQPVSMQARSVRHTSELRACALSVIPAPPSVVPAPAPSSLAPLRHSCARLLRPLRHSCESPLRHSCAPLRHSCAGRNPGEPARFENGADAGRPPRSSPSFPRAPLRHSCAGRNPGEPARFENGADAGRPPAGPSARSVIPAQAGIQANRLGSRTAPMLDGLPQVRAPLRHSCAGRNPGEPARFENGADAGRPPAGPSARSGGLVARRRDGGVAGTWVVAWIPACAGMDGGRRTWWSTWTEGGRDDGVMDGGAAVDG